jgi:GNAT superfamily N-acetyltransferase
VSGYAFEPVGIDDVSIERSAALLNVVFPHAAFTAASVRWQYRDNPAGSIIGWNAVAPDGSLAAHYVVQPLEAIIDGEREHGALSLNTATHPGHQGKGLFTELARRTFESAAQEGCRHVVGVANANSTPGFTRKLGFMLVAPLDSRIGFALTPREEKPAGYERVWSREEVAWRAARPGTRYRSVRSTLYASMPQPFLRAVLATGSPFSGVTHASLGFRPVDVWIGLEPSGSPGGVRIPRRLRPSPLNFIFLDISGAGRVVAAETVRFRALDFDPY